MNFRLRFSAGAFSRFFGFSLCLLPLHLACADAQITGYPGYNPMAIPPSPFGDLILSPSVVGTRASLGQMRGASTFGSRLSPNFNPAPAGSVTFFPPLPPILGAAVTTRFFIYPLNGQAVPAPEKLADYVNEDFYPALGTRLATGNLDGKLDERIEAYRTRRTDLVNRLLEQIELTKSADPEAQERTLTAFASTQTPALVALEAEAEQLRADLVDGGFFTSGTDWSEHREWALGVTRFPAEAYAVAAEFQVMRATSYYQKGFSPEQRGLLREIALDIFEKTHPGEHLSSDATTAMFFSPELARVRLPKNLPPALVEKIGIYNREKTALKTELREAVFDQDKTKSAAKRAPVFAALADLQHPRFAALETLAEEIRRELAALPVPSSAAMPRLPTGLGDRIEAYNKEKIALNTELNQRIAAARNLVAAAATVQPRGTPPPDELRPAWAATTADPSRAAQALAQANADFKKENATRYESLQRDLDTIRRDVVSFARTQVDPATGRPLDPNTLMRNFNAAADRFDRIGREEGIYKNYKIATLLPGLSPEQRRLLFGAALVGLAQPLPAGERMPDQNLFYPRF